MVDRRNPEIKYTQVENAINNLYSIPVYKF